MSIMSLMTNCVHIAITSRVVGEYFPFLRENRLVLIFVLEVHEHTSTHPPCVVELALTQNTPTPSTLWHSTSFWAFAC